MTPYIFLLVYATGTVAALVRGPIYGLYLYIFAFYFSPESTWWAELVPDIRYLYFAAITTVVSTVLHGTWIQSERNRLQLGVWLFVALVGWIWLTSFWALSDKWQDIGTERFTKHLIVAVLIVVVVKNLDELKSLILANTLGCAWIGWSAWGKSGARLEGMAGALGGANILGMYEGMALIIAAMMLLGCGGWYRLVTLMCAPLIVNTVIQSGSRGASLGFLAGGLVAAWYCPRELRRRFVLAGCLGLALFAVLASDDFIERLETLTAFTEGTAEVNETSGRRLEIIQAQWQMFLDNPMGTGFKGTAVLSPKYMDQSLLTIGSGGFEGRSAHNSFMGVLVEYSVVGLGLYLFIHFWMLRKLKEVERTARGSPSSEMGSLAAGLAGASGVILVAGQASDYYYAEIQYWLLGMTAVLVNLQARTLVRAPDTEPALAGAVTRTPI